MPKTTKTSVHQGQNGQYKTTIPKALGDAMNLDGAQIEWEVHSADGLIARRVTDE